MRLLAHDLQAHLHVGIVGRPADESNAAPRRTATARESNGWSPERRALTANVRPATSSVQRLRPGHEVVQVPEQTVSTLEMEWSPNTDEDRLAGTVDVVGLHHESAPARLHPGVDPAASVPPARSW